MDSREEIRAAAIKAAPAWLVSLVFHTLLIIMFALLYIGGEAADILTIKATYAESLGDQLEDDTAQAAIRNRLNIDDPAFAMADEPVDDPLAAPPNIEPLLDGYSPASTLQARTIGIALTGREPGMKDALLGKYGGNATTKAAVQRALEWLKRNQLRDGLWSLTGPYSGGAIDENKTAATAMALLAFQGDGHTHKKGEYREEVARAWKALLALQDADGNFYHGEHDSQRLYSQGQAMIAVCEIYGMTRDPAFRAPAQKTVDYAARVQAEEGGWRYRPGFDSDTSVTGWFVMGFQSALMAGLNVPQTTLQRVSKFLDSVAVMGGSYYKYQPIRRDFTPAMTAEGLLCRQYLGWRRNDPRLAEGVAYLLENPINWKDRDVYYWYYATQVLHHVEGDAWDQWNRVMRQVIPENQESAGPEAGSWSPTGDFWSTRGGGRLYTTCLSTYMLEVYYRHLPIYSYRLE